MIATIISLSATLQGTSTRPQIEWVAKAIKYAPKPVHGAPNIFKEVQSISSSLKPATRTSADSRIQTMNPPILSDETRALWREASEVRNEAYRLAVSGRAIEASRYVNSRSMAVQDIDHEVVIDCELLAGQYEKAYVDQVADLNKVPSVVLPDELVDRYLRLSLAVAGMNKCIPGQADYVRRQIRQNWYINERYELTEKLSTRQQLMVSSALALALYDGAFEQPFFDLAVKLAPAEEMPAKYAIYCDEKMGRYSGIRQIAKQILANSEDKETRSYFQEKLYQSIGHDDLPGSSIIMPAMSVGNLPATP